MTVKTAATSYEARWRKNSDPADQWSSPVTVGADGHVSVPGLERVTDYTFEARAVSACGAKSAWATQTFNLPAPPAGTIILTTLASNVTAAQAAADTANAQLAAIASDNLLSPSEKPIPIRDYSVILTEHAGIDAQADAYAVSRVAYDTAVSALSAYLAGLTSPTAWNDVSGNTTIDGPTFRGKFADVYSARQALLNAIYAAAKALADAAQGSATAAQTGGAANIMPADWSTFSGSVAPVSPYMRNLTLALTTTAANCYGVSQALAATATATGALFYAAKAGQYMTLAPNSKWIVQLGCRCSQAGRSVNFQLIGTDGATILGESGFIPVPNSVAGLAVGLIDCSASAAVQGTLRLVYDAGWGAGVGLYISFLGVEQQRGVNTTPSAFMPGAARSMDEVPDSATRFAAAQAGADKTSSNPQASEWLSDSTNLARGGDSITRFGGRTLDNVGDSVSRFAAAEAGADKTAGKSLTVLTDRTLDNLGDTGSYVRMPATSWHPENVPNASFTSPAVNGAVPGWGAANAALSIVPASGALALQVNALAAGVAGAYFTPSNACQPGDVVAATVTCNVISGNSPTARVQVQCFDVNGNALTPTGNSDVAVTSAFSTLATATALATMPANAASFRLFAYVNSNAGATFLILNPRVSVNDVRVAGSGKTVGDQRNLLAVTFASVGSSTSNAPLSWSISGTFINFVCGATTVYAGSNASAPFSASSITVTQAAGTTQTWYLFYLSQGFVGGSAPLHATTDYAGLAQQDWAVVLGKAVITVAAGGGGSSGSGGGTGGGGGNCVRDTMYLDAGRQARDAQPGDVFDCIDLPGELGKHQRKLVAVKHNMQPCVRLVTDRGAILECSESTPFDTPDGRTFFAPKMLGEQVVTDHGIETVMTVARIGDWPVAHCFLGGVSYAAGADPRHRIYSHNIQIK